MAKLLFQLGTTFGIVWMSILFWLYTHVTVQDSSPGKELLPTPSSTLRQKHHSHQSVVGDRFLDGAPPVLGTLQRLVVATAKNKNVTTEIVYALPHDTTSTKVVGIALLLHGCTHSALKFFSPNPVTCESCIGLSEELRIARIVLQQGTMAVVAVTSQNRKSGCWSPQDDIVHVERALEFVKEKVNAGRKNNNIKRLDPLIVVAFGASSGGRFAAHLAVRGVVNAAFVGVMSLGHQLVLQWTSMMSPPPLYLAPMVKDARTLDAVQRDYQDILAHHNESTTTAVRLDTTTCNELSITADYLHSRVPHMTLPMAQQIVTALLDAHHLHPKTGLFVKDPTRSDWRDIVQQACGSGCIQNQLLQAGYSPLAKALHRAWAFHEYCSEAVIPALEFFQQQLSLPFALVTDTTTA